MKCAKCGAEIKEGCIYCSVCGQEIQIVPDYNVLEEDFLAHILEDEENRNIAAKRKAAPQMKERTVNNHKQGSEKKRPVKNHVAAEGKNQKKKSRIGLIIGVAAAGVVIACGIMFGVMSYSNKHSFTYQYNQGLASEAAGDYENALVYLKQALELNSENLDVRFDISDVYLALNDREQAVSTLNEIIELDNSSKKAYQKLIALYEEDGDYDAILSLYEKAKSDNIKALFSEYQVSEPKFSKEAGTYEGSLEISLTSAEDAKIYYTLDGTSPEKYGEVYSETIKLKGEGEYQIQAVCENEKGIYSEVVTKEYTITYTVPDQPTLLPGSGSYNGEGQMITIQVPAGCNAYYIWNNSEDNSNWGKSDVVSRCTMYIEPIPMETGNNILEVYTVSPNGKISRPVKCNYIYNP